MMHFIKILFLGISIFFSFGFTTYQSTCGKQEIKVEENAHSCCHSEKKTSCTKSKDCQADCCLKAANFFILNQFVIDSEELVKVIVFESVKYFDKTFYAKQNSLIKHLEIQYNYTYLSRKISSRQIISLKQSWLI